MYNLLTQCGACLVERCVQLIYLHELTKDKLEESFYNHMLPPGGRVINPPILNYLQSLNNTYSVSSVYHLLVHLIHTITAQKVLCRVPAEYLLVQGKSQR